MQILLAIPSYSGQIPLRLMSRLIHLDKPTGATVNFAYTERAFIDIARSGIAKQCVMHGNDYLLFCDDDQIPPKDVLIRMIKMDKDIVGCPIPNRRGEKTLNVFDLHGQKMDKITRTQEVSGVGMGVCLIKASVLRKMLEKYAKPFEAEVISEQGTYIEYSEDINFCRRARLEGFEVWCCAEVVALHLGEPKEFYYADGEYFG